MCSLCARDQHSSISLASFVVLYEVVVDLVFAPKNELFSVHVALNWLQYSKFLPGILGSKFLLICPLQLSLCTMLHLGKHRVLKRNNTMQLINHVLKY